MKPAAKNTIVVNGLTKRFGSFTAVDRVSFEVERGDIFGFLGPNGSGKSTVIRMLCGLLAPTEGDAELLGISVRENPGEVKKHIGYMSQQFSLYRDLTVHENMRFFGQLYGLSRETIHRREQELGDYLGLHPYRDRQAGKLSGGWKQRLALACSMMHEPEIVFLDEPTAGIDPVARRELWDLLFDLSAQGITFFVTTHYMDEAERCTKVAYIYLSRLIACDDTSTLKQLPAATPEGCRRIEIRADPVTSALDALRKRDEVRSATIFGDGVHLLVDETANNETLREFLRSSDFSDVEVRDIQPSLEDVFVELTLQEERNRR
ncbi:MAG: ATP-binding cassette domain-containing protein [bacterium]|nr:ATP-binding cassette domain-containing protein [bacterium]